jgi:phosphatidylglycerol:prolipoprotein diacylglycerol transferase
MLLAIPFPAIDPVLVEVGPLVIRWYALAYIAGIVLGWRLARRLATLRPVAATPEQIDDFVTWVTLGIILGGRLGYVLFYRPGYYLFHPLEILAVWQGGMSFHGGAVGVILAIFLFARRHRLDMLALADRTTAVVPIGLFFGRLANFINGELWGRVADVPWAMVFPHAGPEPRHPSQLYQAGLEGLALFALLMALVWNPAIRARRGFVSGAFLAGYGAARLVGELFRQPDAHLGFLFAGATMGQLLSVPMVLVGAWLMLRAKDTGAAAGAAITDGTPGRRAG